MTQIETILKYFPDLSEKQIQLFSKLEDLYSQWNAKINVISRKDIEQLYLKHVLHSLAIAKFIQFEEGSIIVDIGTGGGFPGIPLAIMFPTSNFVLVDSIGKKIKVVNEICTGLELKNVTAINDRIENLKQTPDFYVTRAVASLKELHTWINKKISKKQKNLKFKNGLISLKGGDLTEEIKGIKNLTIQPISEYFDEEFFETKVIVYSQIQ